MRKPTEQQKLAAAERRAAMRKLAKMVSALSDDQRAAIADQAGIVTIAGHPLSPHNCCMVFYQNPSASVVGGFRQWRTAGRTVRRGERALSIWVPVAGVPGDIEPAESDLDDEKHPRPRFLLGSVFDVAQTEPIDAEQPETAVIA